MHVGRDGSPPVLELGMGGAARRWPSGYAGEVAEFVSRLEGPGACDVRGSRWLVRCRQAGLSV
jgi:hypothetical protein